jgi:tellurite resistance protein TerC
MSFRRLLLLENIFDLGGVRVRDTMRSRTAVKVLQADAPWEANLKVIRESRFSRFPLLDGKSEMPLGVVHVKDLLYEGPEKMAACDLRKIARPFHTTTEETPLENLLSDLQRHRGHLAMVRGADNKWTGFISLEDIIEEIIGTIEDEFEVEPPTYLADAMTEGRVVLGVRAANLPDAVGAAFGTVAESSLPLPVGKLVTAVLERERAMSTYLGNGLAIPHARIEGLEKPTILFARSEEGIPTRKPDEKAHLIFILLTPAGAPRAQVRLLARICGLIDSEYVAERLLHAETPAGVLEAVRAGEPLTVR